MKKTLARKNTPPNLLPSPRAPWKTRLIGLLGLAALLMVLSLVATHRAQSAGGAVAVQVTNTTPLSTSDAYAAYAQPFQANIYINIANGASGGGDNGNVSPGTQTVSIPAGKRLVVETVSMYRSGAISSQTVQIFINGSVGGNYAAYALPAAPASTASYSGLVQPIRFSVDGGTQLLANAYRNGTTGAESETVTISGYLVNTP